jgi:ferredoxin
MRRCGRCGESKPTDAFAWRRKARGQLDNYCRPCRADYKQEHYRAHKQRYVANAAKRRRTEMEARIGFLLRFFSENPCVDCGEQDPVVLEFDHLGHKEFNVAKGIRDRNWESVLAEISKCEVVCANCHRRRTARRGGFLRSVMAAGTSSDDAP